MLKGYARLIDCVTPTNGGGTTAVRPDKPVGWPAAREKDEPRRIRNPGLGLAENDAGNRFTGGGYGQLVRITNVHHVAVTARFPT